MSKRIWIVAGIILIGLPLLGLSSFFLVKDVWKPIFPRPIAMVEASGTGIDTRYRIDGVEYRVILGKEKTAAWTTYYDVGWRKNDDMGRATHRVDWMGEGLSRDKLYALDDGQAFDGFYYKRFDQVLYPQDDVLPTLDDITPDQMVIYLGGLSMTRNRIMYTLDDADMIEYLIPIVRGGDAPVYEYTVEDLEQLQALTEDPTTIRLRTPQAPGMMWMVDYAFYTTENSMNQPWTGFRDATDEQRANEYPLFYVALQIMKHGERVR